jgi:hypothetical protein
MANENKPLNEAKPNEPITAQRWNDMQVALRKEHIEHRHNGSWKDGNYSGDPLAADGLADNAVTTRSITDGHVTAPKLDQGGDFRARSLVLHGTGIPSKAPTLTVTGWSFLLGPLKVNLSGKDSLYVQETFVELGGGGNPLRFTSAWSSFTEQAPTAAEISNDAGAYKALMIVGNRSAGGPARRVAMWDRVDVMGRLVVGPGLDAGLTVNGPIEAGAIKGTDLQVATLNATTQATAAALKVTGLTTSGPTTITGALSVSEPIVAAKGVQAGPAPLQAFNRVQIQNGGLHMDGNPVYLRTGINDQYDLLRWNPNTDAVDLGGFNGVNLGFTKNAVNVVAPMLAVREANVEVGLNANPLRFSSGWSDSPSIATNRSEISNDTSSYKTLMIIGNRSNDGSTRRVSVWDRLEVNGTLHVNGNQTVSGRVTASSYNVQYYQYTFAAANNGATFRDTVINYGGIGYVQVFAAFAVFNGFSLWSNNANFLSWGGVENASAIPQHAFANVVAFNNSSATVRTFCSESNTGQGGDNTVLATLVVIGRTN